MPVHSPANRFSVIHIPTIQPLGCDRQSLKLCISVTLGM